MIADFEQRLADVLGARLPAPLSGMVDVVPGRDQARLVLGVSQARPIENRLFTREPEQVPGAPTRRRVVRLECDVSFTVRVPQTSPRSEQMQAFDRLVYLLDGPEFRSGNALQPEAGSDPGFLLQRTTLLHVDPPGSLVLRAEGLFWPLDVPGESGVAIREARLRVALEPLRLRPERLALVVGGATVGLTIEVPAIGTLQVERGGRVSPLPFGSVVVAVMDAGGRPGAGTLQGGQPGASGRLLVPVVDGMASVQYTPPAQAAADQLVVALDDGTGDLGLELGRFSLDVRGA